jgi:hypothetical protein
MEFDTNLAVTRLGGGKIHDTYLVRATDFAQHNSFHGLILPE